MCGKSIKKSVNISLSPELLEQARQMDINLSALLSEALIEKIREHQRAGWLDENRTAIGAVNQFVEENGSFSDFQGRFNGAILCNAWTFG